jgi:predicted nucleic acid-binding protein
MATTGNRSKACEKELSQADEVIVPTLVLYEVYRKITTSTSEDQALSVIALLSQHTVIDLSRDIALSAADISIHRKIPMADAFILAHAQQMEATLVTLDHDFHGIPGVLILKS